MSTYTIESLGQDSRWFIVGGCRTSGDAQDHMRSYQRLFPRTAFRVVETRTRGAAIGEAPHRRGVVIGPAPDAAHLVFVRWDDEGGYARAVHRDNLVRVAEMGRADMRAEHAPRHREAV